MDKQSPENTTYTLWRPQQHLLDEGRYTSPQSGQQQPPRSQYQQQLPRSQNPQPPKRDSAQKPEAPKKMPKARALTLVNRFKKGIIAVSIVSFGTFSGLAAFHQVGYTTASQATPTSTPTGTSSSSSSQSSNSFLQQGGNNIGTGSTATPTSSSTSQGSSNGTASTSPTATPVSGTHTS